MNKFKDECDLCHEWKTDCHGYEGLILCPECALKKGYELFKPCITKQEKIIKENTNKNDNR